MNPLEELEQRWRAQHPRDIPSVAQEVGDGSAVQRGQG